MTAPRPGDAFHLDLDGTVIAGRYMASYPQLELDRQLCFALYTASRAVVRTYGPLLDEAGLTYPQYVTLLALWEDPERSRSVGELGERLHLDSGTLTPLLKQLASMGYVTRARDADDERRVLVTLTAEGLTLRERLAGVPESFLGCLGLDVPETDGSATNWPRSPPRSSGALKNLKQRSNGVCRVAVWEARTCSRRLVSTQKIRTQTGTASRSCSRSTPTASTARPPQPTSASPRPSAPGTPSKTSVTRATAT